MFVKDKIFFYLLKIFKIMIMTTKIYFFKLNFFNKIKPKMNLFNIFEYFFFFRCVFFLNELSIIRNILKIKKFYFVNNN